MLSDGQRTFTYDTANRLTSVTQGSLSTTFRYNGDGDRYAQTTGGVTTDYVLAPVGLAQVLVESANSQSTQYLPGLGQYSNSAWSYYLPDRLGSVRHLVNPAGTPLLSQSYDPFGNTLQQGGTGQSVFGYTGEQTDPTQLVYLRARYYDPAVGRFLTADNLIPDPLRSDSWNRSTYVENNPVRYVDPSGHQAGCLVPRAGNGISEPAQCIPEGGGARGAFGSSAGSGGLNPRTVMLVGGAGIVAGGTAAVVTNMALDPEVPQMPTGMNWNETPIIPCFEPGIGLGNGSDLLPPVESIPLDGNPFPIYLPTPFNSGIEWPNFLTAKRTPHGEERHSQGDRPTSQAYQDKQNPQEVYIDNDTGYTVYVGPKGRTHIFTSEGEHHTSFPTTRANRIYRVLSGRWTRLQ